MENHDTFNLTNIFDFENWIIVGLAMWKMFMFFWPILVIAIVLLMMENRKEIRND
tara:strand:+ start:165 stop:329 length:165 start_codon:yes stop_codon:yes gene_type:complete